MRSPDVSSSASRFVAGSDAQAASVAFDDLLRALPIGAVLIDPASGAIVELNDAACRQLGYDRGTLARLTLSQIDAAHAPDQLAARIARIAASAEPQCFTTRQRTCTGLLRDVEVTAQRVVLAGRVLVCSLWLDVTGRGAVERALRASAEHLRAVLEGLQAFVAVLTPEGTLVNASRAPLEAAGLAAADLVGRPFWTAAWWSDDPRAVQQVREACERALAGERARFDVACHRRDGAGTIDLAVHPLADANGQVTHLIASGIDVTERRRDEARLAEQERRLATQLTELEAVYRTAPVGLAVLDCDLRFVRINERLAEINGASVAAHLGRSVREMVPALTEPAERALERVIRTGEPLLDVEVEGETPARPGVPRVWIEHFHPVFDSRRRVIGMSAVVEDVTERRAAQARLAESRRQLALVLEAGQLGTWDWDVASGHVRFGGWWARMLGWEEEEVEPHVSGWERLLHPDDAERAQVLLQAHLDGRTAFYECESRMRTRSGEWRWVLARGQVIERDAEGRPVRMVGTHQDVTERHEALEALREADRSKDDFLAMLAHELRNPLAPIASSIRLIEHKETLSDTGRRALAIIERQARQMSRLVDDLLEVSRITRGRIVLRPESMLMNVAVANAAETVLPAIDARGQTLDLVQPSRPVRLTADPARIAQVLENLLTNASKYTPEGGAIRVEVHEEAAEVVVRVTDDGIGIPPEKIESIFELFVQADPGVGLHQGGLGIGLSLVRNLVEMHGGVVAATSAGRGCGSTFEVRLPKEG